jgi:hypothetical protein
MPSSLLSIRSAKARDLARRLAQRENRSISDIILRALEAYEGRAAAREPPYGVLRPPQGYLRSRC